VEEKNMIEEVSIELEKDEEGTLHVVAAGRRYSPPQHTFTVFTVSKNKIIGNGEICSFGLKVMKNEGDDRGEIVLWFGTKIY
jgi:hypothetical protein